MSMCECVLMSTVASSAHVVPAQQVALAGPLAARLRLHRLATRELLADALVDLLGLRPIEDLDQKISTGSKQLRNQSLERFEQTLLICAIAFANPAQLGRRIGEEHIAEPTQMIANLFANSGILDVTSQRDHVRVLERRLDGHQVHSHDATGRADRARCLLEPTAGPATQIHHPLTARENAMLPLQLSKLVDRPRAEALALCALVEVVFPIVSGDDYFTVLRIRTRPSL